MFRHPSYYKNLRKLARNSELHVRPMSGSEACDTDQAISPKKLSLSEERSPGPGPKQQASSDKLTDPQATSDKHQAPRHKRQA